MGFSRQEYWSGLSCPPPGDRPNTGIEHRSPALQANSEPPENPKVVLSALFYSWETEAREQSRLPRAWQLRNAEVGLYRHCLPHRAGFLIGPHSFQSCETCHFKNLNQLWPISRFESCCCQCLEHERTDIPSSAICEAHLAMINETEHYLLWLGLALFCLVVLACLLA